jgi:hypothetical protein
MDDDTIGETIDDSTGTPTNSYGAYALYFYQNGLTNPIGLHDLRISYATIGISAIYGTGPVVADAQFVNCASAFFVVGPADVTLRNILVDGGSNVFSPQGDYCTARGEHVTFHQAGELVSAGGVTMGVSLTNSLVVAMSTNYASPLSGVSNQFLASDTGIFNTVGAGYYYLATNSPYRNAGTTNLDSTLLADLRQKTTYPPVVLSNVKVSVDTTLGQQAQRDTDAPDLGYHYAALDYIVSNYKITNATLIVTNGAVIGYYDNAGIWLQDGATIASVGTPQNPNRFAHYLTVQEQPKHIGPYAPGMGTPVVAFRFTSVGSPGTFRFTHFSRLPSSDDGSAYNLYTDGANWRFSHLTLSDCTLSGGDCFFSLASDAVLTLQNNCFERQFVFLNYYQTQDGPEVSLRNNLFRYGTVYFSNNGSTAWGVHDNVFDSGTVIVTQNAVHSHNAYVNSNGRLQPTNANDVVLTSFAYTNGPLGNYYQLSTDLLNAGSTNADMVGLYHYTTQTNQVKETNSVVDIGFHYVAVDGNGNPLDTDGDGTPDYQEDGNGNGTVNSGETDWNDPNDLGLKVLITRPQNGSQIP